MSDTSQAIQDLKWLQDRFQGIMELSKDLDEAKVLENQVNEMKKSSEVLKDELNVLNEIKAESTRELEALQQQRLLTLKKIENEADNATAQAKLDAKDILAKAELDASELRTSATDDQKAINAQIKKSKAILKDLEDQVSTTNTNLLSLQKELADLKAKF